jgi:hypothetical protein
VLPEPERACYLMEKAMSMAEQLKRGADQGANTARETMRKGEAKAQETIEAAQEGFQIAGDNARQMTLKLVEIMRANTDAFCNFVEELANARDPGKMTAVWTKHMQNQMELLSKQSMDMVSLGQKMAATGVNSMSDRMR